MLSSDVPLTDVATQPRKSIDLANRLRVHGGLQPSESVSKFDAGLETQGMRITFKARSWRSWRSWAKCHLPEQAPKVAAVGS